MLVLICFTASPLPSSVCVLGVEEVESLRSVEKLWQAIEETTRKQGGTMESHSGTDDEREQQCEWNQWRRSGGGSGDGAVNSHDSGRWRGSNGQEGMRPLSSFKPPFSLFFKPDTCCACIAGSFLLPIQSTEHFDFKRNPRKLRLANEQARRACAKLRGPVCEFSQNE
jgi:hypothetical protein